MVTVIKRDGREVLFDEQRMIGSIEKAVIDSGLPAEEIKEDIQRIANTVLSQAKKKGKITTVKIKTIILEELNTTKKEVTVAWKAFDERYK
jgi:transcriptional repressor NrdR